MISLKKQIDQLEERERVFEELKLSYLSALEGIEDSLIPVSETLVEHHREQLKQLRLMLGENLEGEVLPEVRSRLADELRTYSRKSGEILGRRDQEIKHILHCLSEAASTLATQSQNNSGRLMEFTRSLETLAQVDDLPEIRRRLSREVTELKHVVSEINERSGQTVDALRAEVKSFRAKLAASERIAHTDVLTDVPNRRAGEEALHALIGHRHQFCILVFDLDRFKSINDRWGHQAGDFVLVEFARRLTSNVRPGDSVFRWGGDEFLAVLPNCKLTQATARAGHIISACKGQYTFTANGERVSLFVLASLGMAEYIPGDSVETIFQRADEQLYRAKGRRATA
jgi:diguanylate cyclase